MLALIGGTGFNSLGKEVKEERVTTKYGQASVFRVSLGDEEAYFIPRHGKNHTVPPHRINYRANAQALRILDVTGIVSVFPVTSISKYLPEELVFIEDFMDFSGNAQTLFDDFSLGIRHKDMTKIGDIALTDRFEEVALANKIKIKKGGVCATINGPRYETKAEVVAFEKLGANLIDMSAALEMTILQELEIDYTAIGIVSKYATGIDKKIKKKIRHEDMLATISKGKTKIDTIMEGLVKFGTM